MAYHRHGRADTQWLIDIVDHRHGDMETWLIIDTAEQIHNGS